MLFNNLIIYWFKKLWNGINAHTHLWGCTLYHKSVHTLSALFSTIWQHGFTIIWHSQANHISPVIKMLQMQQRTNKEKNFANNLKYESCVCIIITFRPAFRCRTALKSSLKHCFLRFSLFWMKNQQKRLTW